MKIELSPGEQIDITLQGTDGGAKVLFGEDAFYVFVDGKEVFSELWAGPSPTKAEATYGTCSAILETDEYVCAKCGLRWDKHELAPSGVKCWRKFAVS